jgi:predicted extracellular nuclease
MPMQRGFALLISLALALSALLPLAAPSSTRAVSTELFFSEYIEGSSNNKALEIYNGTGAPVDLAAGGYSVQMFFNGSATAGLTLNLAGTVASGDVHVIAQSSANPTVLAQADQTNGAGWFNGDDAVVLRKGTTVVDVIGQIGTDPGTEWGSGLTSTADNTLRRAAAIEAGDPIGSDAFDPSAQWEGFATDTFDGLGVHVVTPEPPPGAVINEFSASTAGTDVEYVEALGAAGADLSNLTILEIEGDSGSAIGSIDEVISVGTTDGAGRWLGDLPANALENGTISLLLVSGFMGTAGSDLDSDDDGVLDATPWDAIVDAVAVTDGGAGDRTYGSPVLGPNYDGVSSFAPGGASRIPDGTDTDTAADWVRNDFDLAGIPGFTGTIQQGEAYNTPGAANEAFVPPPTGSCGDPATLIHAIQGSGATSPLAGTEVRIEGIVVGDFQNNASPDDGELNGFYVQEQDADADADAATSEGIFVFAPDAIDVAPGDLVRVVGTAVDFPAGSDTPVTEITSVGGVLVCATGFPLPTPAIVTLPVEQLSDFERYEGMLVTFPQALTISEFFNYDRFGEIVLTVDRDFQPTAVFEPDSAEAAALAEANRLNRITLDDGLSVQNPSFTRHPNGEEFTLENRFRGGDTVANATGVIDHSFGLYRVHPTEGADYTAVNLRPAAPEDVGGDLTVATFNVLNYFTTLDLGPDVCGPAADQECRGADNAEELARQQAKIVAALATIDADVVGLLEIENHPGDVPTATLVDALNAEVGVGTYDYVATGAIGTDAIRVALIYKPATVSPASDVAVLDSSVDDRFDDTRNRPVLAQAFEESGSGGIVTVAVNHLKSKGSDCGGPPDDDPVQGNCNLTRTMAAEALVDWLAADPTGSGDLDALVIGDLNSYDKEDPIEAIRAAGYAELVRQFQGEFAYSYLFDGQLGYLDTALASPTLASQVTGTTIWHINADEPDLLDYDTSFKSDAQDALFEPDAYRSSDHDPVIVGLDLAAFGFGGLEPPIDEANTARAGRTVAVKFSLADDVDVDDVLYESMQVYDCGGWPLGDSVDAASAGGTGLRYDPADDHYVFTWKTDSSWAGECKLLVLTLSDGSYVTAEFAFRP